MSTAPQPLADPIGMLLPWCGEEERALRNRILRSQRYAADRARRSTSVTARELLWLINGTAAAFVTASATNELLTDVADTLVRLGLVANAFERWEAQHDD